MIHSTNTCARAMPLIIGISRTTPPRSATASRRSSAPRRASPSCAVSRTARTALTKQEAQHQQQKAVEQLEQVAEWAVVGARQRIGQADLVDGAAEQAVQQPDVDVRLGRSQVLRRERLILGPARDGQTKRHEAEHRPLRRPIDTVGSDSESDSGSSGSDS